MRGALVDIAAWLRELGLERYGRRSGRTRLTPMVLPKLTADDLKELGVTASGTGASC